MKIDILISEETTKNAELLLEQPLPSSIRDLWSYFQELSQCLWTIRDEIDKYIDDFPTKHNLPYNFRYDARFNDSHVKLIEDNIEKRMKECSKEAKRIELEKEAIALNALKTDNLL